MRGGGRGECSATQYQPSDDTDEVLLRSRFKVEPGVVPGADSAEVPGVDLEEVLGADLAVGPGAHQGAGEVSAEEALVAVEGVSESLAGCTCFRFISALLVLSVFAPIAASRQWGRVRYPYIKNA
jgi:hypothetical protein